MGAIGSACWFTAMAMQPVARVRTLGLIELYFSYVVSRRVFREQLGGAELLGLLLLGFGLVGIVGLRRGNSRLSPRYALQFAGERLTPNRMLTDQLT